MTSRIVTSLVSAALALTACESADVTGPEPTPPTARQRLEAGPRFQVVAADSLAQVTARVNRGDGWTETVVPLAIVDGSVTLHADVDDSVAVDSLRLGIGDIEVSEDAMPGGLTLTNIVVTLDRQARCHRVDWKDDDACYAEAPVDVTLHWAVMTSEGPAPLAPQHLQPIDLRASMYLRGDVLVLDAMAQSSEPLWTWANLVELTDLMVAVHGQEAPPYVE